MNKYEQLRQKHPTFIYHDYTISKGKFSFHFSMDDIHFYPYWTYPDTLVPKDSEYFEYLVFNLGMTELVSYWKCACPQKIEVRCGSLDDTQIEWWKKLYINGLGEFLYRNGIDIGDGNDFMDLIPTNKSKPTFNIQQDEYKGCLIPVGGGKDSVVTMELLKSDMQDNSCYMINGRKAALDTAHIAGYSDDKIINVHRTIDKNLLMLNSNGYLNGHTPFSAIVAFSSYIFAYLSGKEYIVLSNESSANESNVQDKSVNHQYSKSTEFERDFRFYTSYSFAKMPEYFSLLRPLSEWQITKAFVSYKKYNKAFQSCNVGTKTDTWCGKCAKCLYVYIMLAAFLEDDELVEIFGHDMLDMPEFREMFNGLVYESFDKPFECVGTREEINLALQTAFLTRKTNTPILLAEYISENGANIINNLDNYFDEDNFVPTQFLRLLGKR